MDTPDSLLKKWESIEVPSTYVTGPDLEADEQLKAMEARFFNDVRLAINLGSRALTAGIITVEYRNILSTKDHITDDKVQMWHLNGFQPLALSLRTRNDPNYIVAQFAKFPLLDESVERILKFQERKEAIERKEHEDKNES